MKDQIIEVVKPTNNRRELINQGYCGYGNTIIHGNVTVYNAPIIINAGRTSFWRDTKEAMQALVKALLTYFDLCDLMFYAIVIVSLIIPSDLNVPKGIQTSLGKSAVPNAIMSGYRNEVTIKYEKIVKIESVEHTYYYLGKRYDRKQHILKEGVFKGSNKSKRTQ